MFSILPWFFITPRLLITPVPSPEAATNRLPHGTPSASHVAIDRSHLFAAVVNGGNLLTVLDNHKRMN